MVTKFVLLFFCVYPINGISVNERKQCCDLGTNFASAGNPCKDFKPEWAGPKLSHEKICLATADVCCKKETREKECLQGTVDAQNGVACPAEDSDRRVCCEACQSGLDSARAKEPCSNFGLGEPYDTAFQKCCEEYSKTFTPTTTTTTRSTTVSKPTSIPYNYFNTPVENICDSDVCAQLCEPVDDVQFKCDCYKGYTLMDDGISCRPEKRILKKGGRCEQSNPCDQDCVDTGIAIKCSCREGYELADDNRTCRDIDECVLNLHECGSPEDCINEIGTYSCYDSILDNETIDFENKCPNGYKYNFNKLVCDDIDECQFELICDPPKTCVNTIGSFECVDENVPKCPPGFHYKAATESCTDTDECLTGQNDCNKESQFCLNTHGNYTCVDKASKNTCPPGFKKNSVTHLCDDINECEEEDNLCGKDELCVNQPGGHTCVVPHTKPTTKISTTTTAKPTTTSTPSTTPKRIDCPKGYKYMEDTRVCADINECQIGTHTCGVAERCDNTIGSFYCSRFFGCGTGYTLNYDNGLCEDDDECSLGTHHCNELGPNFKCRNTLGSYRCEPVRKYTTHDSHTTRTTKPTKPTTKPTTSTTTARNYYSQKTDRNAAAYTPPPNRTPVYEPPFVSSRAYTVQTTPSTHSYYPPNVYYNPPRNNDSVNVAGTILPIGRTTTSTTTTTTTTTTRPPYTDSTLPYYSPKILTAVDETLPYYSPKITTHKTTTTVELPTEKTTPANPFYDVFQYRKCLPGYRINYRGLCEDINECESNPCRRNEKCVNYNGRFECVPPMQCKIGFELSESGDSCVDVNECSRGRHKCLATQICKNYQGYYTCECPQGHHLNKRTNECEDLDECRMYRPCRLSSSQCVNLKGSFRCDCKQGFKRRSANECEDVNECLQTPELCEHICVNTWGSYRCSCNQGFTLNPDNRTCTDIDECERFKPLCVGNCKNVPGSYACECPSGYKLGSDGRICIDIDECQQNVCLQDEVCLNTRGAYKCYRINCPHNYEKDRQHKSRCKRIQSLCDPRDYQCLLMPEQYTYQYITLVSNLPLPRGHLILFRIKGPDWYSSRAEFTFKILDVVCPSSVEKVHDGFFTKINEPFNSMVLYLVKPIQGPQEIKLQIEMRLFQGNILIGNAVVYIIVVVSEYTF